MGTITREKWEYSSQYPQGRKVSEDLIETFPLTLSKTAFRAHCSANLGGGIVGMARFQTIIDACAADTGVIKYCAGEYDGASTFDKDKVTEFLAVIASKLSAGEASAILDNWPEA